MNSLLFVEMLYNFLIRANTTPRQQLINIYIELRQHLIYLDAIPNYEKVKNRIIPINGMSNY